MNTLEAHLYQTHEGLNGKCSTCGLNQQHMIHSHLIDLSGIPRAKEYWEQTPHSFQGDQTRPCNFCGRMAPNTIHASILRGCDG